MICLNGVIDVVMVGWMKAGFELNCCGIRRSLARLSLVR